MTEESWSEWLQQTPLLSDEWNKIRSLCPEPEASVIGCGLGTAVLLVRLKTIQFWKFAKSKLPFLCQLVLRDIHDNLHLTFLKELMVNNQEVKTLWDLCGFKNKSHAL